jgi:ribulose-5-phosphate 4-epimerase/fuculose-1-phosphate aldolase
MEEMALRERICAGSHELWLRGLIVGDGGLLSGEMGRRRYLVTPPGQRRCALAPRDLACVDVGGQSVGGGDSIDAGVWRPHRLAYQAARPGTETDASAVRATILATPPSLLALLRLRPGIPSLNVGAAAAVPVVDPRDDRALQSALASAGAVAFPALGLLVAGPDLTALLNRVEAIEHAATIELACLNRC